MRSTLQPLHRQKLMDPRRYKPESVGLPPRTFLYTLDQIATLIEMDLVQLMKIYVFYGGLSKGKHKVNLLYAVNLADDDDKPDWRVSEAELVRWMKKKGFRYYERGWLS
jgi:hypothetical protein